MQRHNCFVPMNTQTLLPLGTKPAARPRGPQRGPVQVTAIASPGQATRELKEPRGNWQRHIPLIGETPEFTANHYKFVHERVQQHGPVFQSHVYGLPVTVLTDFEAIKQVADGEYKTTGQFYPPSFNRLMNAQEGTGIVGSTSVKHKHQAMRRRVGAALSGDAVASYLPTVERLVRSHLASWQEAGEFDLEERMRKLTLSFSNEIVVGLGLSDEQKQAATDAFGNFTKHLYCIPVDLPGSNFRKAMAARKAMQAILEPNVLRTLEDVKSGKFKSAKRRSTMQNYLVAAAEEGELLSPIEVFDTVLGLLLAGYDTTAWSYLVLLVLLPQLPSHIMQRLREEQQQVVAQHGEQLTPAALAASTYAEAVAKEALRIKGPVGLSIKKTLQDIQVNGYSIPANSVLLMSTVYSRATDKKVVGKAVVGNVLPSHMDLKDLEACFQPERYLSADTTPTDSGQWGAGQHFCLGQGLYFAEAKALLAIYARHYSMSFTQPGPVQWVQGDKIETQDRVRARLDQYSPA